MISLMLAIATTSNASFSNEAQVFLPLLKTYEFELNDENNYNYGFFLSAKHKAERYRIKVKLVPGKYAHGTDYVNSANYNLIINHDTIKNLPLSSEYGYFLEPGVLNTYAIGSSADVRVRIDAPSEDKIRPGHRLPVHEEWDMEKLRMLAENATRYSFAAFSGYQCVPTELTTIFSGDSLKTLQLVATRTYYVQLQDVANAIRNYQLVASADSLSAQLSSSGRPTFLFVAGANAFKKGDTWIDLPDTTVLINGELWVPTTVLEHLN